MNLKEYIKDRILSIFIFLMLIVFMEAFLIYFNTNIFLKLYIPGTIFIVVVCMFFTDFMRKKDFYNKLKLSLENLDKKYLIHEMVNEPLFLEGKILYDILHIANKSMLENVNKYKYKEEEYREYIEMWVHEIKTPIASSKLIIENNKNKVTESIDEELTKIDNYVEQALYYSRSNNVEKDYIIKEVLLSNVVKSVLQKNKKDFIAKKISVEMNNLDITVYSDAKWLDFIINQVIINSIKYSKDENAKIQIYSETKKDNVVLNIKDNGVGIDKKDLNNIFNKGFTGLNGRKFNKSTGMGLYLCKKLCNKLDHNIGINSNLKEYTNVYITFPIGSYTKM